MCYLTFVNLPSLFSLNVKLPYLYQSILPLCIFTWFCTWSYPASSIPALLLPISFLPHNLTHPITCAFSLTLHHPVFFASLCLLCLPSWLMQADGLYQCFIHNPNKICLRLHFWKVLASPWHDVLTEDSQYVSTQKHPHTHTHTLVDVYAHAQE